MAVPFRDSRDKGVKADYDLAVHLGNTLLHLQESNILK